MISPAFLLYHNHQSIQISQGLLFSNLESSSDTEIMSPLQFSNPSQSGSIWKTFEYLPVQIKTVESLCA